MLAVNSNVCHNSDPYMPMYICGILETEWHEIRGIQGREGPTCGLLPVGNPVEQVYYLYMILHTITYISYHLTFLCKIDHNSDLFTCMVT